MRLLLAFIAALTLQVAFQARELWWLLAACQPLLLVIVAAARRHPPVGVAWLGLVMGLVADILAERIIGPGAISGALAGALVAVVVRRFELEGPLFWIVGSLLAASTSETVWLALVATLGVRPEHTLLGALAAVATTATAGLAVAASERAVKAWQSPDRRRRREIKRL
jgi:rod shape-determining protein MreD